ncbi:MAG: peptidyl-prolyl cis-trans isomerase [Gallionella sp.]|jgi:peptidyl-prolyl cis-trans isomerase C
MLKTKKFATLAILAALAINPAFAEDKSAAVVNGHAISQERVEMAVKGAVAQGQKDSPELRKAIRDKLISLELVAQEATKLGMDKNADLVKQLEQIKKELLANAFVQDYVTNHPVSEDQLKAEYEKVKPKLPDREFNVSHILVKTEAEAREIIAKLGKKAKFEKLAEKSMDTGSAEHGGSLGWAPNNYVPPFANAVLNLKKGEYTKDPVQTQFGWHVIKLEDVRPLKVPTFDELKPQMQQALQQQSIQKAIADLRTAAKID